MKLQRFETRAIDVFQIGAHDGTALNIVIPFRFAAPGPRAMLSLKLIAREIGAASLPFDWTVTGLITWSLWLYKSVFSSGQRIPVQNLLGSRANPARLDDGAPTLNGASIDINVGGDGVDGELTVGVAPGVSLPVFLVASLRGRYNAVAPMCDDEWAALASRAGTSPDANLTRITS